MTTDLGSDEDKPSKNQNHAHTVNRSCINHHQVVTMNQNTACLVRARNFC